MTTCEFLATEKPPRPWVAILRKDLRLLAVASGLVIGILLMCQLGLRLSQLYYFPDLYYGKREYIYTFWFANAAPALIAISVAGICAFEYHQGIQRWTSSLAMTTRQSLFSKLLGWLLISAVVHTSPTAIAIYMTHMDQGYWAWGDLVRNGVDAYLIGLQGLLFLIVAMTLLEPLLGFLVGSVLLLCFQLILRNYPAVFELANQEVNQTAYVVVQTLLTFGLVFASYRVLRWRWGVGQFSRWIGFYRQGIQTAVIERNSVSWSEELGRIGGPSRLPFWSLVSQAFRGQFGLLCGFGAAVALFGGFESIFVHFESLIAINENHPYFYSQLMGFKAMMGFLMAGVLGISTFSMDRQQDRFQFLGYLGAEPKNIVLSRLIVTALPLVIGYSLCLVIPVSGGQLDREMVLRLFTVVIAMPFVAGVITGLIFRNPIIAFLSGFLLLGVIMFTPLMFHELLSHELKSQILNPYHSLVSAGFGWLLRLSGIVLLLMLLVQQVNHLLKRNRISKRITAALCVVFASTLWALFDTL
ncbi:MAG: hypothetical protein KF851_13925 [Pirellulaceae bacterium]|nr:hypothetical protein [Pirellulaceae bacterium]